MKRVRIGPKEKNNWRQIVYPIEAPEGGKYSKISGENLPIQFLVDDAKLKELKPVEVDFTLGQWNKKWPLARIVN